MIFVQIIQFKVSFERIVEFFHEPEVEDFVSSLQDTDIPSQGTNSIGDDSLGIKNGYFSWSEPRETKRIQDATPDIKKPWWEFWKREAPSGNPNAEDSSQPGNNDAINGTGSTSGNDRRFELQGINVIFPPGKISLVTGATASGKTALLRAMLGEMYRIQPNSGPPSHVYISKDPSRLDSSTGLRSYVSYAAQSPWLEHLTIKENILFGSPYEEERYAEVLESCALNPDLEMFEDGDETEIGERGVTLSGGQKARYLFRRF